jgi:proteasome lid subunit RPN8/RPN11
MFVFTDDSITAMHVHLGLQAPEQGGALMGPPRSSLVTQFIPDHEAETTRVSYVPSHGLTGNVQHVEAKGALILKGIVHSHPGTFDRPSGPDHRAFADVLRANPGMPSLLAPIITRGKPDDDAMHEVSLGPGVKMSCYEAWRNTDRRRWQATVSVDRIAVTVAPISSATERLVSALTPHTGALTIRTTEVVISGVYYTAKLISGAALDVTVLFPPDFPVTKPAVLLLRHGQTNPGCQTEELLFPWRLAGNGVGELASQLVPLLTTPRLPPSVPTRSDCHG